MELFLQLLFWIPLLAVFYSYVVYPIAVALFAKKFGKKTAFASAYYPNIGILVPAYNEEKVIRKKIENVLALDYPAEKISVWIGSDQSNDATESIVKELMASDSRIHLWVSPDRGGKTQVVNRLIPEIDAELILLTDANTMHQADCLQKMTGHFADPIVGGVAGRIGHIAEENEGELSEDVYRNYEVNQKKNESALHSCISAFGGFYLIRKSSFRSIPANAYSNDDVLIPMNIVRLGQRMIFEPNAVSEEDLTCDVGTEYKRRIRIGAGNYQSFSWLLDFLNPLKGWPAFCYVSHKAIRWFSAIFLAVSFGALGVLTAFGSCQIYSLLFFAGVIGIAIVLVGYLGLKIKVLRPAYYFFIMNIALIQGFFRFAKGIKSAAWSRTDRTVN